MMMPAYEEDLAYIHDVGFGGFAIEAAPGLLALLRKYGIRGGRVIDLGCGSGLWARELSLAGYQVLGIDISAAMIRLARSRVPQAEFRRGSYLKMKLPRCDAVTSVGECFNYRFDDRIGIVELVRLFRRVYRALRPGGLFVFDIAEPGRGTGPDRRHWTGKDWAVLVQTEEDRRRNRLTRRITTFRQVGEFYRRRQEIHDLGLYKGTEMARRLRRLGFRVRTCKRYGELHLPKAQVALLAQKGL